MKRFIIIIFVICFGLFFSISKVGAEAGIEITCGSTTCKDSTFMIAQLTSSNTASSGVFKDYSTYFNNNYVSTLASYGVYNYSSESFVFSPNGDTFNFSWDSTNGFKWQYMYKHTLTDMMFKYATYPKAGTYAFLIKQTAVNGVEAYRDKTEYILYINMKSDLSFGSMAVKKIKNSNGTAANGEKVSSLSFKLTMPFANDYYESDEVFRLTNSIQGDYADKTKEVDYFVKLTGGTGTTFGYIYDDNGCVMSGSYCKTINFTYGTNTSVTLADGQALVFRADQFEVGISIETMVYHGLEYAGYNLSYTAYSNGSTATFGCGSHYFTLGVDGPSYIDYVWNYPNSNVPESGVILTILPYVVMIIVVLGLVCVIFISRRKSKNETNKEEL